MFRKLAITIVISVSIFISGTVAGSSVDSIAISPFGKVYIYNKTAHPKYIAILISGDDGWKFGITAFAETFSEMNTLVVGVDINQYYKNLHQREENCLNIAADFVMLDSEIEKKYNFPGYIPSIVMGYSSGATLVYAILAQARPGTFNGGISIGFCPDIGLSKMLCQINGLTEKLDATGKIHLLQPDAKLGNPWIVLQGKLDKVCNYSAVADFVHKTSDAELITLPEVGHGFSKWSDFMPQWKEAFINILEKSDVSQTVNNKIDILKDLPLIITNARSKNNNAPIALLISGDGGWYGFEQSIADNLSGLGIPTIGLDSRKYFWSRRTPEETSQDIAKALNYYSNVWGQNQFLLIGYSLGAEIVPFIVNRLPEAMKSQITSSVLLSPDNTTDFEIHISNMLGMGNHQNTYNVTEEIKTMLPVPTLIILGAGEKSDIPELLRGTAVKISIIPGDHHYKFDLPLIIKTMRDNKAF